MKIEDCEKYVLDIPNTLFSNIPYIILIFLIGVFVFKGFVFLNSMETGDDAVLGIIVFAFAVVKLISWTGLPNLEYKPRVQL